MDRELLSLISWPTRRESGVYSGFPGWPIGFAMLQCTAGTLLRRRHSGKHLNSSADILFSLAPPWQCMSWWWVYSYGKLVVNTTIRCWPCLIVPGTFPFWLGTVVMSTLRCTRCFSGLWRMVTHLALCDRIVVATGPLPALGRGTKDTWPPISSFSCSRLRFLIPALVLNMGTWTSTRERTLRGWFRRQCIANATFCCPLGNNVDRVSHFAGWQLIRLLQVFESVATQWVFTTVSLANLCGCFCWALAPFAVCFAVLWMVRRKSGWGICVLPFVFGGLCFGFYDLPRCMRPPVSM